LHSTLVTLPVTGLVIVGFAALNAIRSVPQYSVGSPELTSVPLLVRVTILHVWQVFSHDVAAQTTNINATPNKSFLFISVNFNTKILKLFSYITEYKQKGCIAEILNGKMQQFTKTSVLKSD
jgi:hypothetical protein